MPEYKNLSDVPEGILRVAKDVYLIWSDYYNGKTWSSYKLWNQLNEEDKLFWVVFTVDTFSRYSNAKM